MKRLTEDEKMDLIMLIINKQLSIYNLTYEDVKDIPDWYSKYTMNDDQFNEWKMWSIDTIKKTLKCSKARSENEFNWLNLSYGLKIDNNNINNKKTIYNEKY